MLENISSMFWTLLMCQGVRKIKLIEEICLKRILKLKEIFFLLTNYERKNAREICFSWKLVSQSGTSLRLMREIFLT